MPNRLIVSEYEVLKVLVSQVCQVILPGIFNVPGQRRPVHVIGVRGEQAAVDGRCRRLRQQRQDPQEHGAAFSHGEDVGQFLAVRQKVGDAGATRGAVLHNLRREEPISQDIALFWHGKKTRGFSDQFIRFWALAEGLVMEFKGSTRHNGKWQQRKENGMAWQWEYC